MARLLLRCAAPVLHIDAVKHLQQRWQAEAHAVPLDRRHEQKLWDAFRKPIDDAFNRKTAEREKAEAALGERDRVVLDAAKALEAANASGDAQKIRSAMNALEAALHAFLTNPWAAMQFAHNQAAALVGVSRPLLNRLPPPLHCLPQHRANPWWQFAETTAPVCEKKNLRPPAVANLATAKMQVAHRVALELVIAWGGQIALIVEAVATSQSARHPARGARRRVWVTRRFVPSAMRWSMPSWRSRNWRLRPTERHWASCSPRGKNVIQPCCQMPRNLAIVWCPPREPNGIKP